MEPADFRTVAKSDEERERKRQESRKRWQDKRRSDPVIHGRYLAYQRAYSAYRAGKGPHPGKKHPE